MAVSWGTIKSLLIFFGPILLPKALSYYRSIRAAPAIHNLPIVPIPPAVSRALLILLTTILVYLFKTLPLSINAPDNIFNLTASRVQIPTDVLFTRLLPLRSHGLTDLDNALRTRITSLESRLLYFHHGPEVLTSCLFCLPDDPSSYFYYSLPAILGQHLFNLTVLALVTSGLFTGKQGAVWRTVATVAAVGLAAGDCWIVGSYNYQGNARATRIEDVDPFFWRMRVYRYLALSTLNAVLGWLLYLSSTNRAFVTPPSTAERVETSQKLIEAVRSRMSAVGILRNTVSRDNALRDKSSNYWQHEGMLMADLMEDREVVEGVRNALSERIDVKEIEEAAAAYASEVIGPLQGIGVSPEVVG